MHQLSTKRLLEHFHDEGDSAYIYTILAYVTSDLKKREIFYKLKDTELEHQSKFADLLRERNVKPGPYKPSLRIRILGFLAQHGFDSLVLRYRIADETNEIKTYFLEAKHTSGLTRQIAKDEAQHAQVLQEYLGQPHKELWHRQESGGILRNVVYGFNDGLTANFGLIMGVVGAAADQHVLILSGIAGLLADTLSMGSSSYLAAKSEQEVYRHEKDLELEEIKLMPDLEEQELALIYESKGFTPELAKAAAHDIMHGDQEAALNEKVSQELGIDPENVSPVQEGALTGVATFFGAIIPIVPFLFGSTMPFIIASFTISMLSHFAVGAIRSLFTGRGMVRSGIDMFLVGLGVAIAGYIIGFMLTGHA